MQLSDCVRFTDRIRTEKCFYDLYKPYGSSNRSPVAEVMRCNCQTVYVLRTVYGPKSAFTICTPVAQVMRCNCLTVYGPKIVFTIRTDREAVFSDRISLSNRTDRKAVFSDRISLSILDMSDNFLTFLAETILNPYVIEFSYPKNPKMCDPILVTLLKMQPHYSQSSRKNATPFSGTSPLASYKKVPPPPPGG